MVSKLWQLIVFTLTKKKCYFILFYFLKVYEIQLQAGRNSIYIIFIILFQRIVGKTTEKYVFYFILLF